MQLFQTGFMNGEGSLTEITDKHQRQIRLLVDDKLSANNNNNNRLYETIIYKYD